MKNLQEYFITNNFKILTHEQFYKRFEQEYKGDFLALNLFMEDEVVDNMPSGSDCVSLVNWLQTQLEKSNAYVNEGTYFKEVFYTSLKKVNTYLYLYIEKNGTLYITYYLKDSKSFLQSKNKNQNRMKVLPDFQETLENYTFLLYDMVLENTGFDLTSISLQEFTEHVLDNDSLCFYPKSEFYNLFIGDKLSLIKSNIEKIPLQFNQNEKYTGLYTDMLLYKVLERTSLDIIYSLFQTFLNLAKKNTLYNDISLPLYLSNFFYETLETHLDITSTFLNNYYKPIGEYSFETVENTFNGLEVINDNEIITILSKVDTESLIFPSNVENPLYPLEDVVKGVAYKDLNNVSAKIYDKEGVASNIRKQSYINTDTNGKPVFYIDTLKAGVVICKNKDVPNALDVFKEYVDKTAHIDSYSTQKEKLMYHSENFNIVTVPLIYDLSIVFITSGKNIVPIPLNNFTDNKMFKAYAKFYKEIFSVDVHSLSKNTSIIDLKANMYLRFFDLNVLVVSNDTIKNDTKSKIIPFLKYCVDTSVKP